MRKAILVTILALMPAVFLQAEQPEPQEEIRWILNELDLAEWDRWFAAQDPYIEFVPSDFLIRSVTNGTAASQPLFSVDSVWKYGLSAFSEQSKTLVILIGFAVLAAAVSGFQIGVFSEIPQSVLRLLGGSLVLGIFLPKLQSCAETLRVFRSASEAMLPFLLGIFTMFDLSAGGAELNTGIGILCEGMIRLAADVVFPLAVIGCVLQILDCFGEERAASVGAFCHRFARWTLRVGASLYLLVAAVRGSIANHTDSLLFRSAKLAAGALPQLGNLASDSVDTIWRCMLSIRSMLGVTGILMLGSLTAGPLIRLAVQVVILRLSGAVAGMLGVHAYGRTLESAASMMGLALSALTAVFLMETALIGLLMGVLQT